VGLKHRDIISTRQMCCTFNRTSVGLKLALGKLSDKLPRPFNRTSVGLKQEINLLMVRTDKLLIEPVWD